MLNDRTQARLKKDREMTSITLRIPVDVVQALKTIAPQRGFAGYQTLLKSYLSEGLRRDEAQFSAVAQGRLVEALERHGVPRDLIEQAQREAQAT